MPETDFRIRYPDILPDGCRCRGMVLQHPGAACLRHAGIAQAGIDIRVAGSDWGEGYSPTHLIYLVTEGGTDLGELTANAGEILIVPAHTHKRLQCDTTRQQACYIHVADAGEWTRLQNETAHIRTSRHHRFLLPLMEQLLEETRGGNASAVSHLCSLFLHYLRDDVLEPRSPLEEEQRSLLQTLWQEVAASPARPWTVPAMSEIAHLSEGHFHRLVRRLEGVSPMRKVMQLRMEEAMGLLSNTTLTLEAIADRVGYRTAFAFSEAFKKHVGIRPSVYRRS